MIFFMVTCQRIKDKAKKIFKKIQVDLTLNIILKLFKGNLPLKKNRKK